MLLQKSVRAVKWAPMIALLALLRVQATADILTFEHQGSGSGTLAGQPFPTSSFLITATGDTAARQGYSGGWSIDHISASIQIAGLGTFGILTPTRTFSEYAGNLVGFSRAGILGDDLFNGPVDPAFGTWDMLTPIGPITGPGGVLQWSLIPQIDTTGGILIFNDGPSTATFTAIPEPAALSLLGALGLVLRRR